VDLGALRELIATLREAGVSHYCADGVTLTLSSAKPAQSSDEGESQAEPTLDQVKQAALDLLMQSSGSSVRLVPKPPKVAG
jgi:hypothetical protein